MKVLQFTMETICDGIKILNIYKKLFTIETNGLIKVKFNSELK